MGADIRGVTFDFWSTLYAPDLDRSGGAFPLRVEAYRKLLAGHGIELDSEAAARAFDAAEEAFNLAWHEGRPFTARDRAAHLLTAHGISVDEDLLTGAVQELEEAGVHARLQLASGAVEALAELSRRAIAVGLISDTGTSSGRILRRILERDGLLPHFRALSFSDETGHCKPRPQAFTAALEALRLPAEAVAHVGDIPRTDVAGAKAAGMRAIRFAGITDRPGEPEANAVIHDHRELIPLLERWRNE
jgi:HAD superfamily hydrolase (TIGR01549 family)